jgi:hypothetical protein
MNTEHFASLICPMIVVLVTLGKLFRRSLQRLPRISALSLLHSTAPLRRADPSQELYFEVFGVPRQVRTPSVDRDRGAALGCNGSSLGQGSGEQSQAVAVGDYDLGPIGLDDVCVPQLPELSADVLA